MLNRMHVAGILKPLCTSGFRVWLIQRCRSCFFREELVTVHTEQRMRAPLFRQWNAGHFQYEYRFEGTHP